MSTLRPVQCSESVHQVDETSDVPSEATRDQIDNFPRRHALNGSVKGGVASPVTRNPITATAIGVCHQLGQVSAGTYSENPVSGFPGEFSLDDLQPTSKDVRNHPRMSDVVAEE